MQKKTRLPNWTRTDILGASSGRSEDVSTYTCVTLLVRDRPYSGTSPNRAAGPLVPWAHDVEVAVPVRVVADRVDQAVARGVLLHHLSRGPGAVSATLDTR